MEKKEDYHFHKMVLENEFDEKKAKENHEKNIQSHKFLDEHIGSPEKIVVIDSQISELRCIDGRGTQPEFGAVGGDTGVWLRALQSAENLMKSQFTPEQQVALFDDYLKFTKKQKFYLHSDGHALEHLEKHFEKELQGKKLDLLNPPEHLKKQLMECLLQVQYVGCGHLNATLKLKTEEFSTRKDLILTFIKDFYLRNWNKKGNEKLLFELLQGDHKEQAVEIIHEKDKTHAPEITPMHDGKSTFVYHPDAVYLMLQEISQFLHPYLVKKGFKIGEDQLLKEMLRLEEKQKDQAFQILAPTLPVYKVLIE